MTRRRVHDKDNPKCRWCDQPGTRFHGSTPYCVIHARFVQMRGGAKTHGKAVPGLAELEAMRSALVDMRCPHCRRQMHWGRSDGPAASQITLQHYRDGTMGLLCHSCNSRHAAHAGDDFMSIPVTHKLCRDCGEVKPLEAFGFNRNHQRFNDRHTYCRGCMNARVAAWRSRRSQAALTH